MNQEIRVVQAQGAIFVSSKEVAEKFKREHFHVLRSIRDLGESLPDDVFRINFKPIENFDKRQRGDVREYLLTRDGFTLLAFGFSGSDALQWKIKFIECFNKMEKQLTEELPRLKAEIKRLEAERRALPGAKKPHGNKGMVPVSDGIQTIFGQAIQYKKVQRDDPRYSPISYMEGELDRLSRLAVGMNRKISELGQRIALERRR
jgi:Rha family phage regulatory protein